MKPMAWKDQRVADAALRMYVRLVGTDSGYGGYDTPEALAFQCFGDALAFYREHDKHQATVQQATIPTIERFTPIGDLLPGSRFEFGDRHWVKVDENTKKVARNGFVPAVCLTFGGEYHEFKESVGVRVMGD